MRPMRSMLYIPANSPGMLQHAPIFGCDSILIDLEDAIAYTEKDSARVMASWFLREFDFKDLFVTVRINGADTEFFEKDIETIIPCRPHAVRLPKCNSEADVLLADEKIGEAEEKCGMARGTVQLHAMVETALGLENAFRIASACPRVTALTLGGQDFTADMGIQKTRGGRELPHSRRGARGGRRLVRHRLDGPQRPGGALQRVEGNRRARLHRQGLHTPWADSDDPQGFHARDGGAAQGAARR